MMRALDMSKSAVTAIVGMAHTERMTSILEKLQKGISDFRGRPLLL